MPAPQRGWIQQYNYQMQPTWAQKLNHQPFLATKLRKRLKRCYSLPSLAVSTNDWKYLIPILEAIQSLKESTLSDEKLARYYELRINRPLFINRSGKNYILTYSDKNLPDNYRRKTKSRIHQIQTRYQDLVANDHFKLKKNTPLNLTTIDRVISLLDANSLWVFVYCGQNLVGQPKFKTGERYTSSNLFARNVMTICHFLDSWI